MSDPSSRGEPVAAHSFRGELETLLNSHSQENMSDTPDFLLAQFLVKCLQAYGDTVKARDAWYSFEPWAADREV